MLKLNGFEIVVANPGEVNFLESANPKTHSEAFTILDVGRNTGKWPEFVKEELRKTKSSSGSEKKAAPKKTAPKKDPDKV